jgi:cytochrome c peroxidase
MTSREVHGLHLFRTKAKCILCHQGPLFTDNRFHHTGLSYYGRKYQDLGLYETTGQESDKGKFKTPSLRELKHTAPYMHNGFFPHLTGVLNMYNRGMTFNKKLKPGEPALSPLIEPLNLTSKEIKDLEAFLLTLSSKSSRYIAPPELIQ